MLKLPSRGVTKVEEYQEPGTAGTAWQCLLLAECGLRIKKAVECFKWGLLGHTNRGREDNGAKSRVDYDGLT